MTSILVACYVEIYSTIVFIFKFFYLVKKVYIFLHDFHALPILRRCYGSPSVLWQPLLQTAFPAPTAVGHLQIPLALPWAPDRILRHGISLRQCLLFVADG